ncbi:MAG: efflux RND transporter periplasmic adaptor subunit [Candidatus Latescibacteria bacterium]|nr:efflux RND transporter periplasmic adaptor subunit [Candidatus Latescibacterota bacterium]
MKIRFSGYLMALALGLGACGDDDEGGGQRGGGQWGGGPAGGPASIPVKAEAVKRGAIAAYIQTHARLESERWIDVVARVQGLTTKLAVEEGDKVQQGDLLATLDEEEMALRVQQVEVGLAQAQSAFARSEALFQRKLVSEEEYDQARHQVENIKVDLREARLNQTYATIRSPIDGVVMMRNIELGDMVRANDAVFTVADLDPLLARIHVPEKRMLHIRPDQEARLTIDAFPERVFNGRIRMINPGVDPQSGTVKVTLEIPADGLLRPGMFATVRLITQEHPDALVIPKKALVLETDEDDVFVLADGKARRTRVELGFVDGNRVEVRQGLEAGDQVITVGQEGLKDGAAVRIAGQDLAATGGDKPATPKEDPMVAGMKEILSQEQFAIWKQAFDQEGMRGAMAVLREMDLTDEQRDKMKEMRQKAFGGGGRGGWGGGG